jgi:hypothetical protein
MHDPRQLAEAVTATLPDEMGEDVKRLITDYCTQNPDDRPSFAKIRRELKRMDCRIMPDVDREKADTFMTDVRWRENKGMKCRAQSGC